MRTRCLFLVFAFLLISFSSTSSFAIGSALGSPVESEDEAAQIQKWCEDVQKSVKSLNWKLDPCGGIAWRKGGESVQGRPLVYADFGNVNAANTTLIFSAVHGDEVTPLYLGIQLARWLQEHQTQLENTRVVIAPFINPDGFFSTPRTRMNARGVDVNRNFATKDWGPKAHFLWKSRYRSDRRRFPGDKPRSEPETIFQEELILRVHPQKILSIHSPLNHLDYDGPSSLNLARFDAEYALECEKLRKKLRARSAGFFPGSLGNFAGYELGIPTVTLELPSADPNKADRYWKQFTQGIRTMIHFTVPRFASKLNSSHGG